MGKDSPDTVIQQAPAPDPGKVAAQQAAANRITQFTPFGNIRFGTVGPSGEFVANAGTLPNLDKVQSALQVEPSAAQQALIGNTEAGSLALSEVGRALAEGLTSATPTFEGLPELRSNIDFSGLTGLPSPEDFSEDALRVEGATFDRALSRLAPVLGQREERLTQTLADRGLPVGGEAADAEIDAFNRGRNDLLSSLALDSVGAGRAEQQRLFGNALATRSTGLGEQLQDINVQNVGRATGFSERAAERGQTFNELAALLGLNSVPLPNVGQFVPPGQVDVVGANQLALSAQQQRQNAALANAQLAQQSNASTFGSLAGLAGQIGSAALLK